MTNVVILDGRLTADPDVIYGQNSGTVVASFTLAVGRIGANAPADFIRCKAFNKTAETIRDYCKKGTRILANGMIQTGSYKDRDGKTVFTTDVVLHRFDFLERKDSEQTQKPADDSVPEADFMDIPDDAEGGGLPFN